MYPFSPKVPSHPCCHITLSRVSCAILYVLAGYPRIYILMQNLDSFQGFMFISGFLGLIDIFEKILEPSTSLVLKWLPLRGKMGRNWHNIIILFYANTLSRRRHVNVMSVLRLRCKYFELAQWMTLDLTNFRGKYLCVTRVSSLN